MRQMGAFKERSEKRHSPKMNKKLANCIGKMLTFLENIFSSSPNNKSWVLTNKLQKTD